MHRFQTFLRGLTPTLPIISPEKTNKPAERSEEERFAETRPPAVIKNGRSRFDSTIINPVIFRKHFSVKKNRKRLFFIVSAFRILR
jgi:hypothetical protein